MRVAFVVFVPKELKIIHKNFNEQTDPCPNYNNDF